MLQQVALFSATLPTHVEALARKVHCPVELCPNHCTRASMLFDCLCALGAGQTANTEQVKLEGAEEAVRNHGCGLRCLNFHSESGHEAADVALLLTLTQFGCPKTAWFQTWWSLRSVSATPRRPMSPSLSRSEPSECFSTREENKSAPNAPTKEY